ncbi:nitroreductase family deazaflavin-dependent oxidoreductase [Gordonia jacobaea]|uniref:nitroreductase family deazaflavin-dependent oxidoreductase n=1 Tax=Gordonia jacobaea TaxID=122202 RepID=UPI003D730CCD
MQLPAWLARANKKITNPLQRRWAPYLAPWAMVHHVGRKSGRIYSIPVLAWVSETGDETKIYIILTYGRDTDWVRNTLAAGSAGITRKGKQYKLIRPTIIPADSPDLPLVAGLAGRAFEWALQGTLVAPDGREAKPSGTSR